MNICKKIMKTKPEQLQAVLDAVLQRYAQIYPGWSLSVISINTQEDEAEQLSRMIAFLQTRTEIEKQKMAEKKN